MLKEIFWSDESRADINEIIDFILIKWSEKIVSEFLDNLESFTSQISNNPKTFPLINIEEGIRKCVISKHNSIYYVDELNFVEILRVFDNRQDPKKLAFLE
jgi:plasmid stabilization system protein ParE